MAVLDYELILMLDPEAADDAREKVASDAKSKLEAAGEIKHEGNWGTRKMAYEIDRQGEADYRVWRFTGGKDLLDDLDHSLKITDGVLRFRIFKVPADSPNIVPPDTEQVMRRDDDDRDRGRGRGRDDRGPRRPRSDDAPAPATDSPAPPAAEAPAPAAEAPVPEETPAPAEEAPAPATEAPEPAAETAEAPEAPAETTEAPEPVTETPEPSEPAAETPAAPADEAAEPAAADPDPEA